MTILRARTRQLVHNILGHKAGSKEFGLTDPIGDAETNKGDVSRAGRRLRNAAAAGHVIQVQSLLRKGATIDSVDESGWTALHFAAFNGKLNCVAELLKAGANVELRTSSGKTAEALAALNGHPNIVKLFVQPCRSRLRSHTPFSNQTTETPER